jgi:hypothetical protein
VNYALAQDPAQAYVSGDLGAYIQAAAPAGQWLFAGGVQGATDLNASALSLHGLTTGRPAYFVAAQFSPPRLEGTYSLLFYRQPAIPGQPFAADGISFNAVQRLTPAVSMFVRVNHASGALTAIATSVGWGIVADPLPVQRPFDQAGIGFAWNQTNRRVIGAVAHGSEFVVEAYYNYAVFRGLKIGPDLQINPDPALVGASAASTVLTLRTTAQF